MQFSSINPYNGEIVGTHEGLTTEELDRKLASSHEAFLSWRQVPLKKRTSLMIKAGQVLREHVEEYARMITLEMGKPIQESRAEVNKCAWVCDYYAERADGILADQKIDTGEQITFVRHDPIGAVLAIMPWNFPFWQVFRFAAPTLVAGNTGLLKHAPNVFGCSRMIEEVFRKAGFPEGVFQQLIVHHDQTERIIAHDAVQAVTLTGSERAGSAVAALAGKYIKRSVMELGGNNAFIVWDDADVQQAVQTGVAARMLNGGQSCIAAKRFLLMDEVYDEFVEQFTREVCTLTTGDPLDEKTRMGPLARKDLADQLNQQIRRSVEMGAQLIQGGKQEGCFHEPTILGNVQPGMPAFDEETFGPLATMTRVHSIEEAFRLSELSRYGLGVTICTSDPEKAMSMAGEVSDGAYFVNELVKSDPRLPFGGTKKSGYGRELAEDGMLAFVNRKTVYVAK